ncbi:MAG: DUF4263 domain-containing protein [Methylococcales bacterium]|nr:DUF4263 domain-containing protein [Methylococcales bacterium]
MIKIVKKDNQLLLIYESDRYNDVRWLDEKLKQNGSVSLRHVFNLTSAELLSKPADLDQEDERIFLLGVLNDDYYKVRKEILNLKYDMLLSKEIKISNKTFIANRDISIFSKIDELINEPIIVGGVADSAIPIETFDELLANFPTTTELTHYAKVRINRVLKDYLGTMSDAQMKLDSFLNKKKTIRNPSKIDFIKDYESKKFEYVHDEINAMLKEVEVNPSAYKESDWQRQITEFILLLFPKYIAVLEKVHIKDFYPKGCKTQTKREIDLMLIDVNGTVDIIEIKRPEPHQLLSKKPGSRGNYTPSSSLSEAIMQVEKYLFHLSKWGRQGEEDILTKRKSELPPDFEIRITNPKGILILGRDNDFTEDQRFDFEIIKRKYANIVDIMTYDDLLFRLNNIIYMIQHNYSKLGNKVGQA